MTNFRSSYQLFLADLDGVIYEGKRAIDGAVDSIVSLQRSGIPVGFVTNNSSRKPETITAQLAKFGLPVDPSSIISSARTGAELLTKSMPAGSRVLVVGGEGLRDQVTKAGFEVVSTVDEMPAAVIQGFSPDVAWHMLAEASYAIQKGAKWFATNSDWTIPQDKGMAPGNGTLISAIHTAVGQLPTVAGKPEPAIFGTALEHFGIPGSATLFIGDRLDTDILGANRSGIDSAVVMTGVCTRKELLAAKAESRPTYILGDLTEILGKYESPKQTKRGYKCSGAEVELLGNKVRVTAGDPKSLGALKAATALIWSNSTPIYGLDVEPDLYE